MNHLLVLTTEQCSTIKLIVFFSWDREMLLKMWGTSCFPFLAQNWSFQDKNSTFQCTTLIEFTLPKLIQNTKLIYYAILLYSMLHFTCTVSYVCSPCRSLFIPGTVISKLSLAMCSLNIILDGKMKKCYSIQAVNLSSETIFMQVSIPSGGHFWKAGRLFFCIHLVDINHPEL